MGFHGRVGKAIDLHFKGAGSNRGLSLKLSNFHENFCISLFYSLKHFAIIFWLLDTCSSYIVAQDLALLYSSSSVYQPKMIANCFRCQNRDMQKFS
jgi:hypothetical protein